MADYLRLTTLVAIQTAPQFARWKPRIARVRDVHIVILKLLGIGDNKLTFSHGGRFKQLSQFGDMHGKGIIG